MNLFAVGVLVTRLGLDMVNCSWSVFGLEGLDHRQLLVVLEARGVMNTAGSAIATELMLLTGLSAIMVQEVSMEQSTICGIERLLC